MASMTAIQDGGASCAERSLTRSSWRIARRRGGDKIELKGERVTPDSQTFFEPLPIMFRIDWRLSIRFLMWIRRYDPINSISEV